MTAKAKTQRPPPQTDSYRWLMLAGVWLTYFCFGLTAAAMAPLVQPIGQELALSHSAMGMILGAWPLVYIASAMPCGAFLDRVGPRLGLLIALLVISASGALRGAASDPFGLFLAVALFGLGGPMISVGGPKLVAQWFQGPSRGLAMGIYITGPALGGVFALAATNALMMPLFDGNWRHVLFAYGLVSLISGAAWLAISSRPKFRAHEQHLSSLGRPGQLRIFTELIGLPSVRLILVMSVGIFFFNHGLNNWLPEILRASGMNAARAGIWAAVPTAIGIVGSLVIPRLALPSRRPAILFALFLAAGASTLLLQSSAETVLAAGLILQGLARGSMMTVAMLTLVEVREVGPQNVGAAGGLFFSSAEIGGVLGPLAIGYLADLSGGFSTALYLLTVVAIVLMGLLSRLRRSHASA